MIEQSVLAVAIIIASASANATTNLVQNGSFESMTQLPGKFVVGRYGFTFPPSLGMKRADNNDPYAYSKLNIIYGVKSVKNR